MTDRLWNWDRLSNRAWPTLLIGNGLSINVWSGFGYKRLLEQAELSHAATRLFTDLRTVNFEIVLEAIWHAERVIAAMGRQSQAIGGLYTHIQDELVRALHRVHVPWDVVMARPTLAEVAKVLIEHRLVFTLNYDLLTYWSVMDNARDRIRDYFWGYHNTFDLADTELTSGRTALLYLHGGVHLWQESTTGLTGKWTRRDQGSLLLNLANRYRSTPNRRALIVNEGTSAQKMAVIRRSDYLSFARQRLVNDTAPTVIFGASFGPQDVHVVEALATGRRRKLAISVRPGSDSQNTTAMAHYRTKLPEQDLVFFDSRSHPLGDPALSVQ